MKRRIIFSLALIPVLLSSCITVLNPLVTSKNIVSLDAIIGKWHSRGYDISIEKYAGSNLDKDMGGKQVDSLSPAKKEHEDERKMYLNTYLARFNKNGILHYMGIKFTRINNELYAQIEAGFAFQTTNENITPSDTLDLDIFPNAEPTYSIAKLSADNNNLQFRFVNTDFFEDMLANGAIAIKHEKDDLFGTKVISASTEELEKFLIKYGKDDRLYSAEKTIVLQRKPNG